VSQHRATRTLAASPELTRNTRLTAGWRHGTGSAALAQHLHRFGAMPDPVSDPWRLADEVAEAGLTGRGGAGFPTGLKMRSVLTQRGRPVVVANGMESEPASSKDQALLAMAPHLVLDGAVLAAEAVGADVVYLCLSRHKTRQLEGVLHALAERRSAGLDQVSIEAHELPDRYVSSEETSLIRWLNGGEARPMSTPPRPFERGVRGRPTLVDNVETLAHVALIARYGAGWYRTAGSPHAAGTMLVTLAGAVADPGVYEVELGSTVGEILALGQAHPASEGVLIGGYFGTWHDIRTVAAAPLTTAGLRRSGGSPGAGVLWVLPPDGCGIAETARILGYLADQSAHQCGPCMFGLPAVADDMERLAVRQADGATLSRLDRRLTVITGRGACRHPDGAVRMAASALDTFGNDAYSHMSRRACLVTRGRPYRPSAPLPHDQGPAAEGAWR
jgi:NADH:ubiquinone oxidoreductase subunit F (NADH-binding)